MVLEKTLENPLDYKEIHIKVLLKKNDDTLFVCGTNAFNPSCRNYKVNVVLSVGTTQPGGIS